MALRVGLVSSVSKQLSLEREESARQNEQSRLLYELHDTVKQNVHGTSLTLRFALDAERRGDREEARAMFERALAASRGTEFEISRPYDELQALRGESPPGGLGAHRPHQGRRPRLRCGRSAAGPRPALHDVPASRSGG